MHVNAQAGQRPGNRMLYIGDIAFTPLAATPGGY